MIGFFGVRMIFLFKEIVIMFIFVYEIYVERIRNNIIFLKEIFYVMNVYIFFFVYEILCEKIVYCLMFIWKFIMDDECFICVFRERIFIFVNFGDFIYRLVVIYFFIYYVVNRICGFL